MITWALLGLGKMIWSRMIFISRYSRMVALAILMGVFGWSGLQKMIDPAGFSLAVFRYHLLPHAAVNVVALLILKNAVRIGSTLIFVEIIGN